MNGGMSVSNLAYQVQQKRQQNHVAQPERTTLPAPKRGITKGEKLLWLITALALLIGAITILTNYATIYSVNKEIQVVESEIQTEEKVIDDLTLQVAELSAPKRIKTIAKEELGMTFNDKNVEVVEQ
jgi:cell division protein FtsL